MRWCRFLVVLVLATVVMPAGPAWAHSELVAGSPAPCERVTNVERVQLAFSEELDDRNSQFVVTDATGLVVFTGGVDLDDVDHRNLIGSVPAALPIGAYEVSYVVRSNVDGDVLADAYRFEVAAVGSAGSTVCDGADGVPSSRSWVVSFCGLAALGIAAAAVVRLRRPAIGEHVAW